MVGNTSTSAIPLALLYSGTNATYGMFTSSAILNPTSLPNMQQLISLTPSATENPLSDGGNVSTVTNWQNVQTVSSGVFEGMSTTAFNMAAYTGPPVVGDTGAPWPADQCADVTISSVNGSGYITPLVRMNASTGAGYLLSVGPSGSGYTQILKANAGGTRPALTRSVAVTVSNSDIWRICSVGTSISEYQQPAGTVGFNLIQSVSDSSYASGNPGIGMQGTSAVTDAQIGLWAAEANQALSPTFSTYTHGYSGSVTVTSATSGATICYTTNGTQPTRSSSTISNGGTVTVSSPETLKAMAAYTDLADSPPSTVSY
jgi:trimeric autotransporter adhesin